MESILILRSVLQDYIIKQSDADKQILNILIQDECKEYEIARITGYPLSKISRTIKKLRVYLRQFDYN